jgi:NADH:ubiquinone oxidoreductase subunit 6 (subunit J)
MTGEQAVFYLLAAFTVALALMVVRARNIVRAAVALIFSFCGLAGLYVLLDAEFLAAVQVLIYVGGITILMLFAILLTSRIAGKGVRVLNEQSGVSALVAVLLIVFLGWAAWRGLPHLDTRPAQPQNTPRIGQLLMTTYALPFEAVSILLLAGMVGAIFLARKEEK